MRQTIPPRSTVYIVDDNPAVRDAIRWLVEQVGLPARVFPSAKEFLDAHHPGMRGCLVLDIRMPGMSGLDLQERLAESKVRLPIIVVTGHGDVPITVRAMKAGAFEFLQKPFNDQVLLDSIQAAMAQNTERWAEEERLAHTARELNSLTFREMEVLKLLRAGRPSKVIAAELGISARTVEGHRARIMAKLRVRSLSQLLEIAIRTFPEG